MRATRAEEQEDFPLLAAPMPLGSRAYLATWEDAETVNGSPRVAAEKAAETEGRKPG